MMRSRKGFTLIELMVVAGVSAILLGLTLPSIARSQDQARQQACKNNLKQLGLAMHNYHDVYRSFPPGWVAKKRGADEGPFTGWQTAILPYVDQAPLFNRINFKSFDANDEKLFKTVIKIYRCPSDPMVSLNPMRGKWATSSYSGNGGNERLPGSVETPDKLNGIMWVNSNCGIRNITDGTSNTFMIGERCLDSASGIWVGVTKNRNENDVLSDCSHHARLNASIESFSSRHEEGANFLMCDGSIRFISNQIDSQADQLGTYQKLAQKDDGNPIGNF